jgi:hypothetical protein
MTTAVLESDMGLKKVSGLVYIQQGAQFLHETRCDLSLEPSPLLYKDSR